MATKVSGTGTTVKMEIGVWYDAEDDIIKISIPGHALTSVNNDPTSMRGNPSLYKKLGRALRDAGAKHPPGL